MSSSCNDQTRRGREFSSTTTEDDSSNNVTYHFGTTGSSPPRRTQTETNNEEHVFAFARPWQQVLQQRQQQPNEERNILSEEMTRILGGRGNGPPRRLARARFWDGGPQQALQLGLRRNTVVSTASFSHSLMDGEVTERENNSFTLEDDENNNRGNKEHAVDEAQLVSVLYMIDAVLEILNCDDS